MLVAISIQGIRKRSDLNLATDYSCYCVDGIHYIIAVQKLVSTAEVLIILMTTLKQNLKSLI